MNSSNNTWKRRLALGALVFGMALMLYMIIFEDEPGGIPLILIALGGGYLVWTSFSKPSDVIDE